MNHFPFRPSAQNAHLLKTISEIVAPKNEKPAKPYDKYGKYGKPDSGKPTPSKPSGKRDTKMYATEAIGGEGDTHGGGATSPKRNGATAKRRKAPAPVVPAPTTPRVTEPLKISESHSRAALEKMSITQLRALLKKYTAKPGSGRELADIRGLLRAKGAGSVLDEARKGLGKTRYGQALKKLGDAAEKIKANPPKPPVNPFKKVDEACWSGYTARGLKKKGNRMVPDCVKEETPCERAALARLKSANTEDLQDKPGAAGERAHKRLHKTIGKILKQ